MNLRLVSRLAWVVMGACTPAVVPYTPADSAAGDVTVDVASTRDLDVDTRLPDAPAADTVTVLNDVIDVVLPGMDVTDAPAVTGDIVDAFSASVDAADVPASPLDVVDVLVPTSDVSAAPDAPGDVVDAGAPRCVTHGDCTAQGRVCDVARGVCVECVGDVDCRTDQFCGSAQRCLSDACVAGTSRCAVTGMLETCATNGSGYVVSACASQQTCAGGRCQAWACTPGSRVCLDATRVSVCNIDGLGTTPLSCPNGETCTSGMCAGQVCMPNAATCGVAPGTRVVCNAQGTATTTVSCPVPPNAVGAGCAAGNCTFACRSGFDDCDGSASNGCETDTAMSAAHCGACRRACAAGESCVMGGCSRPTAPAQLPQARGHFGAAMDGQGRVYLISGTVGTTILDRTQVDRWDPARNVWELAPPVTTRRFHPTGCTLGDGRIMLLGGQDSTTGNELANNDVFNPASGQWTIAASFAAGTSYVAATLGLDNAVYALAGTTGNVAFPRGRHARRYNVETNSFEDLPRIPIEATRAAAATTNDGMIWLFGGTVSGFAQTTTQYYNPSTRIWGRGPDLPEPRADLRALRGTDGRIYLLGGSTFGNSMTSYHATLWAFDPARNTYETLAPMPFARALFGFFLLRDGRMLVAGGHTATGITASVIAYSPGSNTWQ